jgi:hypothetical protein
MDEVPDIKKKTDVESTSGVAMQHSGHSQLHLPSMSLRTLHSQQPQELLDSRYPVLFSGYTPQPPPQPRCLQNDVRCFKCKTPGRDPADRIDRMRQKIDELRKLRF